MNKIVKNSKKFTVLMSVYKNDKPEDFEAAIDSVTKKQTMPPDGVLLIVDGPVPKTLEQAIHKKSIEISYIRIEWLPQNRGLGNALRLGVELIDTPLIARMDSDDIAVPDRFEKQIQLFEKDKTLSMAGGAISEFICKPHHVVGRRFLPCTDMDIKVYMKYRCAFNHMTVMFRKNEVIRVGNYQSWYWNEDYFLWIRMQLGGCKFANLQDILVNVRVGEEMYARRGGWQYFKSEAGIQKLMLKAGLISQPLYLFNILVRLILQVLIPNQLRGWMFQRFARNRKSD